MKEKLTKSRSLFQAQKRNISQSVKSNFHRNNGLEFSIGSFKEAQVLREKTFSFAIDELDLRATLM